MKHVHTFALIVLCGAFALPLVQSARAEEPQASAAEAPTAEGSTTEGSAEAATDGEHEAGHAEEEHGAGEINWFYGMLGERAGVEPSLLFRPVGMPAPYGASLINSAILFFILYRAGAPKVREGLKKRKQLILQGFDEAAKMKAAASEQLGEYERKLAAIDEEIARLSAQRREATRLERERVLREANERRERMEKDARLLVEQEMKAAHEQLIRETTEGALRSAQQLITSNLTASDKERTLQEYSATLAASVTQALGVNARGGVA
ncbi:MAG TPA: ATP synthase F0 subunit B [Polyangiaceae bacterium]|nr:ATP synthase F0 subunit B [Polyangiaceae bacterium]